MEAHRKNSPSSFTQTSTPFVSTNTHQLYIGDIFEYQFHGGDIEFPVTVAEVVGEEQVNSMETWKISITEMPENDTVKKEISLWVDKKTGVNVKYEHITMYNIPQTITLEGIVYTYIKENFITIPDLANNKMITTTLLEEPDGKTRKFENISEADYSMFFLPSNVKLGDYYPIYIEPFTHQVIDQKHIQVPAGDFDCLVIKRNFYQNPGNPNPNYFLEYYDIRTGINVKSEHYVYQSTSQVVDLVDINELLSMSVRH